MDVDGASALVVSSNPSAGTATTASALVVNQNPPDAAHSSPSTVAVAQAPVNRPKGKPKSSPSPFKSEVGAKATNKSNQEVAKAKRESRKQNAIQDHRKQAVGKEMVDFNAPPPPPAEDHSSNALLSQHNPWQYRGSKDSDSDNTL